jgi:hypothetical protein
LTVRAAPQAKGGHEGTATLLLIALFKLLKGLLLVAVGIGAVKLLHRDVADTVMHWINVLRVDPDNRLIHGSLTKILWVSPEPVEALSAGTLIYAGRQERLCYSAKDGPLPSLRVFAADETLRAI